MSAVGHCAVTLPFTLDRDIDAAAQDGQAAITAAGGTALPGFAAPHTYFVGPNLANKIMYVTGEICGCDMTDVTGMTIPTPK